MIFWLALYRLPHEHPRVSPAELAHIHSDPPESTARVSWFTLLTHRQTWAFALGKFMTDAVWWFYLYWLPKYLDSQHGVTLSKLALPLIVIYVVADVGSVGGGWLPAAFVRRGWSLNRARKTAMLLCAVCVVPTAFVSQVGTLWGAVALVGLAAAAHQGWSANLFTLTSDLFPRRAVASVVGIGGFSGAVGGMLFQAGTGYFLEWSGNNYAAIFLVCGLAYVSALALIHAISPRLQPVDLDG